MEYIVDSAVKRAASHLNMVEHLAGPLSAGAGITLCEIRPNGRLRVDWISREPMLLIAPIKDLEQQSLRVELTRGAGNNKTELEPIHFVPYTEAGSFLPIYRPPVNKDTQMANPFLLVLKVFIIDAFGNETQMPNNEIAENLVVHMVEGIMGRMLYLLGSEKAVLRRMMRELAVARQIDTAHDHALDMLGADLSVPRFADQLVFQNGALSTETRREPDEEYRRRLKLHYSWIQSTPATVAHWLNGEGKEDEENRGLLSELGVKARFTIIEKHNPFALGIRIFATDAAERDHFFDYLQAVYLIHLEDSAAANQIHAERYVTQSKAIHDENLRVALRNAYQVNAAVAIAPALATALDRLQRCLTALNVVVPSLMRGFDPAGGSRYELGLGADLATWTSAEIQAVANAVNNKQWNTGNDAEIERILSAVEVVDGDFEASWLLNACGLRTVHRLDNDRIYVSHFPSYGLILSGGNQVVPVKQSQDLEAYYEAPGLPGSNIVLENGLNAALVTWTQEGNVAWTVLTPDNAEPFLNRAVADASINQYFEVLGLPGIDKPEGIVQRLLALPPELFKVLVLPAALAQEIVAKSANGEQALTRIVGLLREGNLVSVLPFVTDTDEVLLAVGVLGLPQAGLNLSDRRPTGFRWYSLPIFPSKNQGGAIKSIGSRSHFTAKSEGITAVVVLGYARHGLTDPYEYHVDLPEGELLSPLQYEFLMNMLERLFPIGVEINTYAIRHGHVDLDGDGVAEPLLPTVFRTYRRFVRSRHAGQESITITNP